MLHLCDVRRQPIVTDSVHHRMLAPSDASHFPDTLFRHVGGVAPPCFDVCIRSLIAKPYGERLQYLLVESAK